MTTQQYRSEYYQNNKERLNAQAKNWRDANPELVREIQRNWRIANEGHTYLEKKSGYVAYIGYSHPIANPSGLTMHHRIVLWDAMNGQDAFCHWGCGTWVTWSKKYPQHSDALCVDHVNLDKADNRPENLVPSCARCNISRPGGQKERELKNVGPCAFEECDRDASSKGYCSAHYMQHWKGQEIRPLKEYGPYLTEEQHIEIVQRVMSGEVIKSIAADMGYNWSTVSIAFKRATGIGIRQFKKSRNEAGAA